MAGRGQHSFEREKKVELILTPPPLYPPMYNKPARLKSNTDMDYKVLWKENFTTYLRESPYYLNEDSNTRQVRSTSPAQSPSRKKQKVVDVNKRLAMLEQKEIRIKQEVNVKREPRSDSDEDEREMDEDMEMDDDNDYGDNYFDNGEDFNDEDDNLDDGPTY